MREIIRVVFYIFIFLPIILSRADAVQINLTPLLELSEEYNDNIYQENANEVDDFITTLSPGINLEMPWQTAGFTLRYQPSYVFYHNNDDLNDWRHSLSASAYKEITARTRIDLSNDYLYTEEPDSRDRLTTSDDPLTPPAIQTDRLRRGRDQYWTNASTARIEHRFGSEDLVYAAYRYEIRNGVDTNEDDTYVSSPSVGLAYRLTQRFGLQSDFIFRNENQLEGDDLDEWYGRIRGIWRQTAHLGFYAQYSHTIANYDSYDPEEDETGVSETEDFSVYEPTVGLTYNIGEDTRIDIGVGYYILDARGGDDDDGFIVNAQIDKVWRFPRGLLGVTALSGSGVSTGTTEDLGFFTYYAGRVRAEYDLSREISGRLFTGYRWDDYPDEEPEARTDKTLTAGAGITYQLYRWIQLQINYEHNDLKTDIPEDEYTENRVIFLVTLTPGSPYRYNW